MRNPILGVIMWPFAKVLQGLFLLTGSYGVAIILFALLIKLILLYPSARAKRNSLEMARMNPKMQEIKKRCGTDQQKYSEEVMQLYKEQGVSPTSGCLWSFIPIPILFALYGIIRKPLSNFMWLTATQLTAVQDTLTNLGVTIKAGAYEEIEMAQALFNNFDAVKAVVPQVFRLDFSFLGIDLSAIPWSAIGDIGTTGITWGAIGLILIPIISGLLNLFLTLLTNRATPTAAGGASMKTMLVIMPIMSVYMGFILPASLGIYWIAQSLFAIVQEYALQKYYGKKLDKEAAEREERIRADRQRRMDEAKTRAVQHGVNKNTSKDKQKRIPAAPAGKASEANAPAKKDKRESTTEAGRVGARPYARGRSFSDSHYGADETKSDNG